MDLRQARQIAELVIPILAIAVMVWMLLPSTQEKLARACARAAFEEEAKHQERRLFGEGLA